MLGLLAFGLGVGAGIQAWRNFPADGPVSADMAMVLSVVGLVLAYVAGRWRGRGASASASATAIAVSESRAQATNSVNIFTVAPGGGAVPVGLQIPTESAPWIDGRQERLSLSLDDLDGQDLAELLADEHPHEERRG